MQERSALEKKNIPSTRYSTVIASLEQAQGNQVRVGWFVCEQRCRCTSAVSKGQAVGRRYLTYTGLGYQGV